MPQGASQQTLIDRLNPIIQGWSQYCRTVNSYKTFAKISSILFWQLMSWANRRHPELNRYQTVSRYWLVNRGGGWVFTSRDGPRLRYHRHTRFWLHIKIQGKRSPFKGYWLYWGSRLRSYPGISPLRGLA